MDSIVEDGNPKGGSNVETLVWMKAFFRLGNEVFLAQYENDGRKIKENYNWITTVPTYNFTKYKKFLVWYSYRFPKLFKVLSKNRFDYVFSSNPTWQIFYLCLICKLTGAKHIMRIANDKNVDFNLDKSIKPLEKLYIRLGYKLSDFIVAQNEFQFQKLKENYPNKKISKIYNPIVIEKEYLKIKEIDEGSYIAWVANFRYQKNLKLLFEISSQNPKLFFKVAGQSLSYSDPETEEYLIRLKGLTNVEFMGAISQDEILKFLSKSKYLLSTSRYEGFSNTFLEAMIVGTPIITTYNVNPDGIIDEHQLGILYKDPKDFKLIINDINNEKYKIMSKNCIEYVLSHHDYLKLGKEFMQVIGNI
ncbi:glycosyltransferase family 4 protein [Aquiflexum balticum]|nr:glycosyltransferase [Aquiflexum balticum]